ncbi:uncharacterized protein LOC135948383 isoform X2 [Cloeon dipterum]|uniref:uncharacterized protein LOC135948383 isoform X2 n=1 Tax=Cloeon dipterum TaxID=197152 RepID=UPI0032205F7B
MAQGNWCFVCDKWITKDLSDRSSSSKTDEVEEYWKLHESSEDHVTKKKTCQECPDVTWDGLTIYASFAEVHTFLDYRDMCYAMRRYGYAKVRQIDNHSYSISYQNQISAEKALSSNITHRGAYINTRPMFKHKLQNLPAPKLEGVQSDCSDSWEVQAKQLAIACKLAVTPEVERQHQMQTEHLLADIVRTIQPLCNGEVHCFVYGSRATGLADIDSDIDVHVKLDYADSNFDKPLSKMAHKQLLKAAVKLFYKKPHMFRNIHSVPGARVPVLHFLHIPTNVECDVTFKNMLGVYNSQFLQFVASQDERIFLLFFVIKQWRKAQNIQMSNYCLTMLAIFFLQTLPQPMLPPILQLKEGSDPLVLNQGWVCSFRRERIANENKSTLKELVVAYFKFLAQLDLAVDVICPLTASTFEKWKFLQAETLPEEMQGLSQLEGKESLQVKKPVCVQDPFELNHNIAKNLAVPLTYFTTRCTQMADYCERETNFSLEDLLKFTPSKNKLPKCQDNFSQKIFLQNYFPDFERLKSQSIQELWFEDVVNVIYDIFKEVFNCSEESSILIDAPPSKIQKMPPCNSERLAAWALSTPTILFGARKKQRVKGNACYFIKEALTSKVMIKRLYNNLDTISREFHLIFKMELTSHVKPTHVKISFTNAGSEVNTFHSLICFVDKNLQSMVDNTMATPYRDQWQALNRQCCTLEEQLEFLTEQKTNPVPVKVSNSNKPPKKPKKPKKPNPLLDAIEKVSAL